MVAVALFCALPFLGLLWLVYSASKAKIYFVEHPAQPETPNTTRLVFSSQNEAWERPQA